MLICLLADDAIRVMQAVTRASRPTLQDFYRRAYTPTFPGRPVFQQPLPPVGEKTRGGGSAR